MINFSQYIQRTFIYRYYPAAWTAFTNVYIQLDLEFLGSHSLPIYVLAMYSSWQVRDSASGQYINVKTDPSVSSEVWVDNFGSVQMGDDLAATETITVAGGTAVTTVRNGVKFPGEIIHDFTNFPIALMTNKITVGTYVHKTAAWAYAGTSDFQNCRVMFSLAFRNPAL